LLRLFEETMILARVLVAVLRLAGLSPKDIWRGLHPPDQLRRILERERARAHRTGDRLSLVTFAPRCPDAAQATPALLAKILPARIRTTDEVGWLDRRQIGVVLPTTSAAGAWKVADDVCLEFPENVPPPICTVYSYPLSRSGGAEASAQLQGAEQDLPGKRTLRLERLFLRSLPIWKRSLDLVGATTGIVVLLPLCGALAAAVKLSSSGPVLFKQRRSGWGGKPFVIYKFRTMVADAEARKPALLPHNEQDGPAFKVCDDPRVTRLGRLLRQTSLDELPQLWNVLKGDMSLVGPRPLPCEETAACERWHLRRLDATPGLTGIWQVRGRSTVSFAEWVRMDLEYIRSRSLWQDLKLLLLTVPAVVLRKGAH
jgi:lipopolysaccharide/colanic/teichoic acid biosynthesis glycosyltransferase